VIEPWVVVAVAMVTYLCRASFLVLPGLPEPRGLWSRFLDSFPLALFVSLATIGFVAPQGIPAVTPGLAAAAGGVVGAAVTRRSLIGTIAIGAAAYWVARLLSG
jgi:branched-subunit amino acid transport protein